MSDTIEDAPMAGPARTPCAVLMSDASISAEPLGWVQLDPSAEWTGSAVAKLLLRDRTRARLVGRDLLDAAVLIGSALNEFVTVADPDAAAPPEGFEATPHADMALVGEFAVREVRSLVQVG